MRTLLLLLFPAWLIAQQDVYVTFPATTPVLGTDSVKIWLHIPANYAANGGGVIVGLHGLGDPNNSPDIRTYLTATSDNFGLLLACAEPYLGQEDATKLAKSKAVVNETLDSLRVWYAVDTTNIYLCGYSAGSDAAAHYTLENPAYPVKGLIWFAPGFYGSVLYPNIDTAFAAPIPPICMCRGTSDFVSQSAATKIENIFSGSSVPFLKVSPAGIAHTMNYPGFTGDIATCMNFINSNSATGITHVAWGKVKVFPNPAAETISIQTESSSAMAIELCDLSGRVLLHEALSDGTSKTIDVHALQSGVYFLRLTDNAQRTITHKLIKQ